MAKSSINFKPVKSTSAVHNERGEELDYVYKDLSQNNSTWKVAEVEAKKQEILAYCKQVSGRKMQKNAEPIREAVVNLESHHDIASLRRLAATLKATKKIDCFQIHIHRDEGKSKEQLNYHAHMLFDWQDKSTGRTIKLNKTDLSEIQTLVAESLSMERGELKTNSNRERLEPIEFKRQQEEIRLKELKKKGREVVEMLDLLEQKKKTKQGEISRREKDTMLVSENTTNLLNSTPYRLGEKLEKLREEFVKSFKENNALQETLNKLVNGENSQGMRI